ncbi:hypothetical protein KKB40_04065, partial [Patescibacteria group bacterium]|nr:hypothetical protein [Patescibacteria group bacterium]
SEALKKTAEAEAIPLEKFERIIGEYLYTQKMPRGQDIVELLPQPPKIMNRQGIIDRIKKAIENIIDIFEW